MKYPSIADRSLLHTGVALPAQLRKVRQLGGHIGTWQRQASTQGISILNRHAGALCHEGSHRMRCIAQQGHSALRLLMRSSHGHAVAQGPQTPCRYGFDQGFQIAAHIT
jgi:hypothetical protein